MQYRWPPEIVPIFSLDTSRVTSKAIREEYDSITVIFITVDFSAVIEGIQVGKAVGCDDGRNEGAILGVSLGLDVGAALGVSLGLDVGAALGVALGLDVGAPLGVALGLDVGAALGVALGLDVGAALGLDVGAGGWDVGAVEGFLAECFKIIVLSLLSST